MADQDILRVLVDLKYKTIQKNRVAFNNRLSALEQGTDEGDKLTKSMYQEWFDRFQMMEDMVDEQIDRVAKGYDIIHHMETVKGIGFPTAAKIVALIDIEKAPTVSSLWKYCGFGLDMYWVNGKTASGKDNVVAPQEGWKYKNDERVKVKPEPKEGWELKKKSDRLVPGWLSPYNTRVKSYIWYAMSGIIKEKGDYPYREEYVTSKEEYLERGWSLGHAHNAAIRKVAKLFLSHLWDRWRRLEGLPTRSPYIEEYGGHTDISTPEDYGWCNLEAKPN